MKCLSVRQPYAQLIIQGKKTIENRTWKTEYRGPILIHASQTVEGDACEMLGIDPEDVETGKVLGKVTLANIFSYKGMEHYQELEDEHHAHSEELLTEDVEEQYGWVLANPVPFQDPVPMKGQLGLFEV